MGKYGEIQPEFMEERTRILDALDLPENKHITLRLIGALAFRTHCPKYGYFQDALGRVFTDIDFAGYSKQYKDIVRLLTELGYEEDKMVTRLFGDFRLVLHEEKFGRHIDVFLDKLDFCHVLPLKGRLEVEKPTIPLAELVIEKMQIVQINEKDIIDTIMLFREHRVGDIDKELINGKLISRLTSDDWGLWRTVTGNLNLVESYLTKYPQLTDEDRRVVTENINELRTWIDAAPKSLKWKSRAIIGEKKKWYKDVEALEDRT